MSGTHCDDCEERLELITSYHGADIGDYCENCDTLYVPYGLNVKQ